MGAYRLASWTVRALDNIDSWPVDQVAAGWLATDGRSDTHGPISQPFALASVTKPLFALAILVAVEEGTLALDQPAGPEGSTVAHLLSHSSGLGPEYGDPVVAAGTRRIYSNAGFDALGHVLEGASGMRATEYFAEAVAGPLSLESTWIDGSPAHGGVSSVADLMKILAELHHPTLVHSMTLDLAVGPVYSSLAGVLPGFGRQDPNQWGLGFEIRGQKSPHWSGAANSPETFGHFGAAGTLLFVDPVAEVGCVALTDRKFGPWATEVWPPFCDAILESSRSSVAFGTFPE